MPTRHQLAHLACITTLLALSTFPLGATAAPTLVVRASGTMAAGVGPIMQLRVNGAVVGTVEVRANTMTSYTFELAALPAGAQVDVVFTNDQVINGQDRNLFVGYLQDGVSALLPSSPGAVYDRGTGAKAFDGLDLLPASGAMYHGGALRLTWPSPPGAIVPTPAQQDAARLLQQASFGPTQAEIDKVVSWGAAAWVSNQLAMPYAPSYLPYVQGKYSIGDDYRPGGSKYTPAWVGQQFWALTATSPDQLRRRTAFALQQIFTASLADSVLWGHARAFAQYQDLLNKDALGNFRDLLQDMALSPVMGIYLTHMRNRKENPATGLMPDENFARELMQVFSIGLQELNPDGTVKVGSNGKPVETYDNGDVMAMARVFTGWSWGFPDNQLTESNFRWGSPGLKMATDQGIDILPMKAYPGQQSTGDKVLFSGKPWAVHVPANASSADSVRMALDGLFNHPNVGPHIGRQLIQRLVTSNPSPAYVGRVTAAFNNNSRGVRGDLAAVVRAVLLDSEARGLPSAGFGKVREPVLRVSHWMRAFNATSISGEYMMAWELANLRQQPLYAPSVFGYFRPGYVPPNTRLADAGATAPEFQIVDESTTAAWVNLTESLAYGTLGWNGTGSDIRTTLAAQTALAASGEVLALIRNLNLLLYAGRMSPAVQSDILEAVAGVYGNDSASHLNRARVAVFIALSSPEYLVQR